MDIHGRDDAVAQGGEHEGRRDIDRFIELDGHGETLHVAQELD